MDESADVSRRALLQGLAGAAAASTAAGTAAAQDGEETEGGGEGTAGGGHGTEGGGHGTEGEGHGGEEGGGGGGDQRPVFSDYLSDAKDAGYEDLRGQSEVTVEVGADPEALAFSPTRAWVDEGTEITFEWVSDGHNVVHNETPEDTAWEGHEPLEDSGFSYSTTVEAGGMHTYYCSPHESLGMKGAFAVGDDVETESVGGGGGGGDVPQVPDAAKSLGIAAAFAMAATLGLAYFFIKYGGDYGDVESA